MNFIKPVVAVSAGTFVLYAAYQGYDQYKLFAEERSMRELSAEQLIDLGKKIAADFDRVGYSQIPICKMYGLHIRDTYWSYRFILEFSRERLNLVEKVWGRVCCYHLETEKSEDLGNNGNHADGWHFDGGPPPKITPLFQRQIGIVHRDCTAIGDRVMAALAAYYKDPTLATIAVDTKKRSEVILKFYPEETPQRPANCGPHGLLYLLPSTTMMDSPLCPQTFEVYNRETQKFYNLEEDCPGLVFLTVVPGVPLLRYTQKFKPGAWRVVAQPDLTHDNRKTIEYAYGTFVNAPERFFLTKEDERWTGPQDGWSQKPKARRQK